MVYQHSSVFKKKNVLNTASIACDIKIYSLSTFFYINGFLRFMKSKIGIKNTAQPFTNFTSIKE